jgi:hypothetical protein
MILVLMVASDAQLWNVNQILHFAQVGSLAHLANMYVLLIIAVLAHQLNVHLLPAMVHQPIPYVVQIYQLFAQTEYVSILSAVAQPQHREEDFLMIVTERSQFLLVVALLLCRDALEVSVYIV